MRIDLAEYAAAVALSPQTGWGNVLSEGTGEEVGGQRTWFLHSSSCDYKLFQERYSQGGNKTK